MRLAHFISSNTEAILAEWERFARSLTPGLSMNVTALRDHAAEILRGTARNMLSTQSAEEQSEKSQGRGTEGLESDRLDRASTEHALDRLGSGFNLVEVVAEYRALRASVLRLWRENVHEADDSDLQDLTRFNEAIDQSLAEAVRSFTNRVDESRELFLATLGHDLRSPLTAIMVSAQLLSRSQLDSDSAQVVSQMVSSGKVMATMIHDLLDFTRTRLGAGMPVSVAPLDLKTVCLEVADEFRAAYPDRPVRLETAGDTTGEWDAARLRQVLSNLIANAIEHGQQGTPIEVSANGADAEVVRDADAVRSSGADHGGAGGRQAAPGVDRNRTRSLHHPRDREGARRDGRRGFVRGDRHGVHGAPAAYAREHAETLLTHASVRCRGSFVRRGDRCGVFASP
jgi:signal transduction histidine kinase